MGRRRTRGAPRGGRMVLTQQQPKHTGLPARRPLCFGCEARTPSVSYPGVVSHPVARAAVVHRPVIVLEERRRVRTARPRIPATTGTQTVVLPLLTGPLLARPRLGRRRRRRRRLKLCTGPRRQRPEPRSRIPASPTGLDLVADRVRRTRHLDAPVIERHNGESGHSDRRCKLEKRRVESFTSSVSDCPRANTEGDSPIKFSTGRIPLGARRPTETPAIPAH